MHGAGKPSLDVRQERFAVQAHFLTPVFDLLKDVSGLSHHLFNALGAHYNLSLANMRFEAGAESLGAMNLRLSWPGLAEVRIFLDRVEIESGYLQFLRFAEGDLVADVLGALSGFVRDPGFRAFSVTQEVHGALVDKARHDFLGRFVSSVPEGLGPPLGTGMVFYYGAEANHLAASITLDFSRSIEGGIFVQSIVLYDASKVAAGELQKLSRSDFEVLLDRIGLVR
jgi:hypothetical protein